MSQTWKTALIITSAIAVSAVGVLIWKKKQRSYIAVAKVSKLFFYPVKSLKAVEVTEGICTKLGFEVNGVLDRSFMVINIEGVLVSQRQAPSLVLLTPTIIDKALFIMAPNGKKLKVEIKDSVVSGDKLLTCRVHSDDVSAVDCGDEAASFFQEYLNMPDVRLVRFFPTLPKRKYTKKHPYYSKVNKDHPVGFQDLTALHIMSEESINDLNSRIEGQKISALNFRPNILVNGCEAYAEDSWRYIKVGSGALISHILTTTRCLMTTNDPNTGTLTNKEPLVTLRKYRIHKDPEYLKKTDTIPCLGVSCAVLIPGEIKVSEEIFADVGLQYEMVKK